MDLVTNKNTVVSLSHSYSTWLSVFFLVQLKVTDEDMCVCLFLPSLSYQGCFLDCETLHSSLTHKLRKCPLLRSLFLLSMQLQIKRQKHLTTQYNSSIYSSTVYVVHQRREGQVSVDQHPWRKKTRAHRFFFFFFRLFLGLFSAFLMWYSWR